MKEELADLRASLPPLPKVGDDLGTDARQGALGQLYGRLAALGGIYWGALEEKDRERYRALQEFAWKEAVKSLKACAGARPSISHLGTVEARGQWHRSDINRLFLDAGLKAPPPEPPLADQLLAAIDRAERGGAKPKEIRRAIREATKRWSEATDKD